MKRLLTIIICVVLCFGLVCCGAKSTPTPQTQSTGSTVHNGVVDDGTSSTTSTPINSEVSSNAQSGEDDITSSSNSSSSTPLNSSSQSSSSTEPHTHQYTSKVTAATCTSNGYTTKKCSCGHTVTTDKTVALGHSFGNWTTTKEPTTTSTGTAQRKCARCGKTETQTLSKLQPSISEMQQEVLRLVNIERQKEGLPALQYYYAGQSCADIRAQESFDTFSHTRPNGTNCFTVFDEANLDYWSAGENIAWGHTSPAHVMDGWMNSPGHRANILSDNFTHLIVGVYIDAATGVISWCQLFITPA